MISLTARRLAGLYRRFLGFGSYYIKPDLHKRMLQHIASGKTMQFKKHEYSGLLSASRDHSKLKKMSDITTLNTQFAPNRYTLQAGPMHVGYNKRVPMLDIDLPDPTAHMNSQIIHKSKGDFMKRLDKYLKTPQGQASNFDLYDTPGGVRAFDLGVRTSPAKYFNRARALGSDPWYQYYSMKKGAFASRISPKPGRQGDFIAQKFDTNYGLGKVNETSRMEMGRYHDDIIKKIVNTDTPADIDELSSLLDMAYPKGI